MSEFDKEAERERLREKYERDREDREVAQQMSDLLLKGATMTNAHCGECGSPVFRQNGQEFCPTCGAEAAPADEAAADGEQADAEAGAEAGAAAAESSTDEVTDPGLEADQPGVDSTPADGQHAGTQPSVAAPQSDTEPSSPDRTASGTGGEAGLAGDAGSQAPAGDAGAALQRALLRHARAADTEDARVARDHLEAAREAAQALAALRQ